MSDSQLEEAYDYLDVIQVGARNMQNFEFLKTLAHVDKPILFKRGLMATIEEFMGALSYLQEAGKTNIILCERGIRGYDVETRNMLDIMAVPIIQQKLICPLSWMCLTRQVDVTFSYLLLKSPRLLELMAL